MATWHPRSTPHRSLRQTFRGEDVKAFQRGLNARVEHLPVDARKITADGEFGPATLKLWRIVRHWIGLPDGHPPTITSQLNVRRPWTRSPAARKRAKQRRAGGGKPRLITARAMGLSFQWVFGAKGSPFRGAGHYTAGGRTASASALVAAVRSFHAFHKSKGWGGGSYEAIIADDGTIAFCNPPGRMSAAVAVNNTGMANICCPGTTGDRMTSAQKASARWLLANWHTSKVPAEHRLSKPARAFGWLGHHEYPSQSTACPGQMLSDYREVFR